VIGVNFEKPPECVLKRTMPDHLSKLRGKKTRSIHCRLRNTIGKARCGLLERTNGNPRVQLMSERSADRKGRVGQMGRRNTRDGNGLLIQWSLVYRSLFPVGRKFCSDGHIQAGSKCGGKINQKNRSAVHFKQGGGMKWGGLTSPEGGH